MRVLVSAYACEPDKSSEPAVGWNWALQAAKSHDVWVLTRHNNRAAIEAAMAASPIDNLHFVYHDLPRWASFWKRRGRLTHLYYYLWQLTAVRVARRLQAEVGFDAAHHVTFVSQRFPSFLAWLDVPYVWGPVAGAEKMPPAFERRLSREGRLKQRLRRVSDLTVRFDPLVRKTARRAASILAATPETAASIHQLYGRVAAVEPAIGWHGETVSTVPAGAGELRAIFVGRLVHWKGLHLGLEAFAHVARQRSGASLTVVGQGPERERLESQARDLGLAGCVRFIGALPRHEVMPLLAEHNCLLFPSFQDSGGFVVLEAMAAGLPVICIDSGGPGVLVTEETGIRVRPQDPEQVVAGIRDALLRLHDDVEIRRKMGEAGRRRVTDYTWDRLEAITRRLYGDIVAGAGRSAAPLVFEGSR
jgi:glycosyltransferase involved in cell wall biosynthesis